MQVHEDLSSFPSLQFPVVTSGTFDGVHLGHQKIIQQVKNQAIKHKGESVLITFHPHPRQVLFPEDKSLKIITPFADKIDLLDQLGIDHLLKITFDKAFSQKSSLQFINEILIQTLKTRLLVIGYDHRFGRNREGGFEYLKDNATTFGFDVQEIPRQDIDDVGISSTKIRNALIGGDILKANKYLGRDYHLRGIVVEGNKIGRTLGFPTANLQLIESLQLIPADGIYAVYTEYKGEIYEGMLSIGVRPTIGNSERTIEVNIFDFDKQIYHQELKVYFIQKYRDEKKFASLEGLQKQLSEDWQQAKKILANHPLKKLD